MYRYELLTGNELRNKFPQFTTDDSYVAVYQKDGGLVDAATGNAVHIQLARGKGALVIEKCPVLRLQRNKDSSISVSLKVLCHLLLFFKIVKYQKVCRRQFQICQTGRKHCWKGEFLRAISPFPTVFSKLDPSKPGFVCERVDEARTSYSSCKLVSLLF